MILQGCGVHGPRYNHRPKPALIEWHHLQPRDWQRELVIQGPSGWTWRPGIIVPPGATITVTSQYGPVWCPDGTNVPRTCHGNVHDAIVALMHAWKEGLEADAKAWVRAARIYANVNHDRVTWAAALRAPALWTAAGQSLQYLQDRKLWGGL